MVLTSICKYWKARHLTLGDFQRSSRRCLVPMCSPIPDQTGATRPSPRAIARCGHKDPSRRRRPPHESHLAAGPRGRQPTRLRPQEWRPQSLPHRGPCVCRRTVVAPGREAQMCKVRQRSRRDLRRTPPAPRALEPRSWRTQSVDHRHRTLLGDIPASFRECATKIEVVPSGELRNQLSHGCSGSKRRIVERGTKSSARCLLHCVPRTRTLNRSAPPSVTDARNGSVMSGQRRCTAAR